MWVAFLKGSLINTIVSPAPARWAPFFAGSLKLNVLRIEHRSCAFPSLDKFFYADELRGG